jgi:hypothetical protein
MAASLSRDSRGEEGSQGRGLVNITNPMGD